MSNVEDDDSEMELAPGHVTLGSDFARLRYTLISVRHASQAKISTSAEDDADKATIKAKAENSCEEEGNQP